MPKTYFNNAITGNSSMLACITDRGELVRLFWPNIDYPQHIDRLFCGIFLKGRENTTTWFHDWDWAHSQSYIEDTNIVKTVYENINRGLRVIQTDFVLPYADIMIRKYEVQNIGNDALDLGFIVYSSGISTNPHLAGVLFDFENDALVHYRHGYYISISGSCEVYQFQLGNNAYDSAVRGELRGYDSVGMMNDAAVSWLLGIVPPGGSISFDLKISASDTLKGIEEITGRAVKLNVSIEFDTTAMYWHKFLERAGKIVTGRKETDRLYKRSLLVFKLMSDAKSGGLLAAPEVDEEFTRCGRYAYCWGRDAAFITDALDRCGLHHEVDMFYYWALNAQDRNGSWHQRYYMDGNLAPSWGIQIDETGTIIWGMYRHFQVTGDINFLTKVWDSAKKGVEYLISHIDPETGLPLPSHDLWEERLGEHAYSSAAVYGGICAAIKMAEALGKEKEIMTRWGKVAESIKEAILKNFWKDDWGYFIRSIRVKLNPWGDENTGNTVRMKINPKNYYRDFTIEDAIPDISLLGLSIPFGVFDVNDPRIKSTVEILENKLTAERIGGLKRYENDNYMGGNPWIIATLWMALYKIKAGDMKKALEYFQWASKSCTNNGLLPEQVGKDNGEPAWVIPLTWSHAMYVLVLSELADSGMLK